MKRVIRSVRFRLTLWFVVILALILAAFSLFIYFRQVQVTRTQTANRLTAQASLLANYYRAAFNSAMEGGEEVGESEALLGQQMPLLQVDDALALVDSSGQPIHRSANLPTGDLAAIYQSWSSAADPAAPFEQSLSPDDQTYLFIGSTVDFEHGASATLLLGGPVDPGGQLPRLALTLGAVYVVTLLIAFGGGYWLADRAMHPVLVITRTAREIGEHDLSRRLHLSKDDELGQLADTFDQMLNRLERAFERQRQFTADASHELRTPLAVIELETDRALEGRRSEQEYRDALQVIHSENEWMGRLVEQLLTLARMDSGKLELQYEKIELSDIALGVVERLAALARRQGVLLEAGELDDGSVWADRRLLTHLLTNLVANGLKYARGEHARVVVETGSRERSGQPWVWASVADNGPGISDEHLPHLFDRFYRADRARQRSQDQQGQVDSGSGLGLAIVQSIVHSFGGEVEVDSRVGEGTQFTVWLPQAR